MTVTQRHLNLMPFFIFPIVKPRENITLPKLSGFSIKNLLFESVNGNTAFIIAHRLSTVAAADKIMVLDGGRIVQTGTYEKLAQQEGLYRRMFAEQGLV